MWYRYRTHVGGARAKLLSIEREGIVAANLRGVEKIEWCDRLYAIAYIIFTIFNPKAWAVCRIALVIG